MIEHFTFYLVAIPAIMIAGISKGGFGGGLIVMAVPLMSLAVPSKQAAAIMLPLLCFMDLFGVWAYRKSWDFVNIKILLPAAICGVVFGTLSFRYLDEHFIKLLNGSIAIVFTVHYFVKTDVSHTANPSWTKGGIWGTLAGFTSFVAHAGGPPMSVYLLPQKLNKTIFVGTTIVFFTAINYLKLIPYAWLGQFHLENLWTSLFLMPLAFLGVWLGIRLHNIIREQVFYRICYFLLFLTGIKLVYDGVKPFIF